MAMKRKLETMHRGGVQPLVLSIFAPLSLWPVFLTLSTISLASPCYVAGLGLQLVFSILSPASRCSSVSVASLPLWLSFSIFNAQTFS